MKKFFTIPVAILLLLAGMQVTIASHLCCGELAATKFSLSGKLATCGMVHDVKSKTLTESSFSSNCCEDETLVYKVDDNFSTSEFNFKELTKNILQEFNIPAGYTFSSNSLVYINYANVSPPDYNLANAVSLADICVFRI